MRMKCNKMIRTFISPRVLEAEDMTGNSVKLYLSLVLWLCIVSEARGLKVFHKCKDLQ